MCIEWQGWGGSQHRLNAAMLDSMTLVFVSTVVVGIHQVVVCVQGQG